MDEEIPSYDVVVIGAGVAGALIAWDLAEAGIRVLVLEAGPERHDRLELVGMYATQSAKVPSAPYLDKVAHSHAPAPRVLDEQNRGHYIQRGPARFKSTYERLAGGSTWHWLGNAPRFVPNDFRLRSLYGVGIDWPLDYDELEPWYVRAEKELGVAGDHEVWDGALGAHRSEPFPMTAIWPAYGDQIVKPALDGRVFGGVPVRVRTTPQARNSRPYQDRPPCAGNSSCVPICPIGAKYDATVHIERARCPRSLGAVPAIVQARSVVRRLVAGANGKIEHAEYDRWSLDGRTRKPELARARIFVLAAHAIESSLVLLESGLSLSGPVGRYLMDHLQGYVCAIMPEPVYPFRGPPVTSGIDEFRDGPFRSAHAPFRISIGNDGWGRMQSLEEIVRTYVFDEQLLGAALRDAINRRVVRMMRMSFSTEMLPNPNDRVRVGGHDGRGNPRPAISFNLPEYNKHAFDVASEILTSMFETLGATEVRASYPGSAYSGAGHIMGTTRMGATPRDSVVDSTCRCHEHPNLFVAGASIFPTSGTANPTLTVAALALRAARTIRESVTSAQT